MNYLHYKKFITLNAFIRFKGFKHAVYMHFAFYFLPDFVFHNHLKLDTAYGKVYENKMLLEIIKVFNAAIYKGNKYHCYNFVTP